MQKIINKKGLSGIVISVLLILLSIAALAIVFLYLTNFLNKEANLSPGVSCLQMQSSSPLEISSACFSSSNNEVQVSLKRSIQDLDINQIDFVLSSDNDSSSWCCGIPDCQECQVLEKGKSKTYFFDLSDLRNPIRAEISVSSCGLDSVEISQC